MAPSCGCWLNTSHLTQSPDHSKACGRRRVITPVVGLWTSCLLTSLTSLYPRCSVAVSPAFLSLHQSHGPQGLPVAYCWNTCAGRPPPPVTTPLPSIHLHGDRLAIFVYVAQLVPAAMVRRFASFDLARTERICSDRISCCDQVTTPPPPPPPPPPLQLRACRRRSVCSFVGVQPPS